MKFCKECGNSLADNMVFCSNCGTNVTLTEDADGKNHSEDFFEKQNTEGRNSIEETNIQILEQTAMAKEVKTPQKNPKKKVQAKYVVLAFFMVLIGVVGAVIANMDLPVTGDLTGTAYFSVYCLKAEVYNELVQTNSFNPSDEKFNNELPNAPWTDKRVNISELSKGISLALASLIEQTENKIYYAANSVLYATIALGEYEFEGEKYELKEIYVNGKPASVDTYLKDGDKVQAVIVIS